MMDLIIDLDNHSFSVDNIKQENFNVVNFYRKASQDIEIKKFGFKVSVIQLPYGDELVHLYTENDSSDPKENPFLLGKVEFYNADPESSVMFNVVAFNKRESFEDSFEIKIPKPPKPYPSWVWNSEVNVWESPVPKPVLIWDEDSQTWNLP